MYIGLDFHACSREVSLMGNVRLAVLACISFSCSSRSNVMAMGDLVHAWYLSFGKW